MRRTLKALSALLSYPSAELKAAADEIRAALVDERALPREAIAALDVLLQRIADSDVMDLQAGYTDLFDGSRPLSLHLFEHVHGESRERGAAIVDLAQSYLGDGFAIADNEMPDYLPLFLEFVSFLEPAQSKAWLARPAHVLAAMEDRLREQGSPYAAVFTALRALNGRAADPQAVDDVRSRMRAEEARGVDERWEETPVTFGAPKPSPNGRTGIIARIQARLGR